MIHLPALIQDLAIILMTAAVTTILFKALKQPVVLGYILAGLLVSPHVPLLPTVTDRENLQIWAEIGVIFLLFGLGLEFSFKKLARVGFSASFTAVFEVIFMSAAGYLTGRALGWSTMDSLFLGGVLSISSTTIIVRAINELGLRSRKFVSLVFGVLVVEDLVAILLMVLLSTMAVTRSFSGEELFRSILQFVFFLTLWFLVGIYFLPLLFKICRRYFTDETKLIASIGLCLMMVLIATEVGFSPALGAFVMGSLMAETREGKSIEKLLVPVRDLFAAVFFVSVGMLIDLTVIYENIDTVLILTLVTILGKFISTSLGALASGQNLRHSIQAGMSLAQIGEFSFIIATLGLTLGVVSKNLYPIAVAISAITTFTTPYQIKYSDRVCEFMERILPDRWKKALKNYNTAIENAGQNTMLHGLLKAHVVSVLLNTVIVVAVTLVYKRMIHPIVLDHLGEAYWVYVVSTFGLVTVCVPFLWALTFGSQARAVQTGPDSTALARMLEAFLLVFRISWGVFLIGFILAEFISIQTGSIFILVGLTTLLVTTGRYSEPFYKRLKWRFLHNLDDRSRGVKESQPYSGLAPWDANLSEFVMSADSDFVGKTLKVAALREKFGVMVALIERGHKKIIAPSKDEVLMPQDRLFLIGTDDELETVKEIIEKQNPYPDGNDNYGLQSFVISDKSKFKGKSIRECGVRDSIKGLVVGLERNAERILNPDSNLKLREGDVIWVVGDRNLIRNWAAEVMK